MPETSRDLHDTTALALEGRTAVSAAQRMELHPAWPILCRMPVKLAAKIPLSGFKVRGLLTLARGQVVASAWSSTEDVPLMVDALQLCWSEFEVVEGRMALRLTRLV